MKIGQHGYLTAAVGDMLPPPIEAGASCSTTLTGRVSTGYPRVPHGSMGSHAISATPASSKLSGLCKIKLRNSGYRVVYSLIKERTRMRIIAIALRDGNEVYREAERRLKKINE